MFAQITQTLGENSPQIVIPQLSVVAENQETYVWVVNQKNQTVQKRDVVIGENLDSGLVVVTKGLKKNEIIVNTGMQRLNEKAKVKILKK